MFDLIPAFDFRAVFITPWTDYWESTLAIVAMGFFVTLGCGLAGMFVVLRRMSLVGDAISHSVLPGIVLAFLITGSRSTPAMFTGAVLAGALAVVLIEVVHRRSRVKPDAAIGIVFSTLFAAGVVMVSLFADKVDLDTDCLLYGEIAFTGLAEPVTVAGLPLGPLPVVRMGVVTGLVALGVVAFYKELLVTSFDSGLAGSLGLKPAVFHYGLALVLAVVIVSAFESVGAILVIAMLIFPGATALLLFERLPRALFFLLVPALVYPLGGLHLATWLNCSIAGAMTVVAGLAFLAAWVLGPRRGLLSRALHRWSKLEAPGVSGVQNTGMENLQKNACQKEAGR